MDRKNGRTYLSGLLHEIGGNAFADRDRGAVFEQLSNIWVHLDGQVLILNDLRVAQLHSTIHPVLKVVAAFCVDHVGNVFSGKLFNFFDGFRQRNEGHSIVAPLGILQEIVDR